MSKHNDKVYLGHILESIQKIESYISGYSLSDLKNDNKTVDAIIRNFEIIGEASNNISEEYRESHPELDFRAAVSMRNRLAHGYDDVNLETVWNTVKKDLPELKAKIEKVV